MALGGCNTEDPTTGENGPSISSIKPSQVVRGRQNVKSTITGSNFIGTVAVDLGEGVEIKKTTIVDQATLAVTFSVRPEASIGPRTITITTPSGTGRKSGIFSVSDNAMPIARFTVSQAKGVKDEPITFDASASTDSDGVIKNYDWNFGDGQTAGGQTVTHSYAFAGAFQVTLTVTDNAQGKGRATRSVNIIANKPPIARYIVFPKNGNTSTVFSFDGSESKDPDGRVTDYIWDFDDGQTGGGKKVTHRFEHEGNYFVSLTVTDDAGLQHSALNEVRIEGDEEPIADFTISPSSGPQTTNFLFDASPSYDPDGSINIYEWNLDDGTVKSGKIIEHQFSTNRDYLVRLTVTDDGGLKDSAEKTVRVSADEGSGDEPAACPDSERIYVNDGGLKPFCNSRELPTTYGPDHPVTVLAFYDKKQHRVMDIRVYHGDDNDGYCCQDVFHLCTEFRNTSGVYVFGASGFEIGPSGRDGKGYYRDYYLYRGGAETFGHWPPVVGSTLFAHFVQCQ